MILKYLLPFCVFLFVCPFIYCQTYPTGTDIYTSALGIEQSIVPDAQKLHSFYKVKKIAEQAKSTQDFGYFFVLVKIAKYESFLKGNNKLAVQFSQAALDINRTLPHTITRNLLINASYNLATYYQRLQQETDALAYYDTTIILCGQNDPDDYLLLSRYQRAVIYFGLSDYQKVIEESTLGIADAKQRNDLYHYTCCLNHRANAYLYQNEIEKATDDVNEALVINKPNDTYGMFELARSYMIKAQLFQKKNDYQQAETYFKKAIIVRPHDSTLLDAVATDYNDIGNFYLYSLGDFVKAKANFSSTVYYANQCNAPQRATLLMMAYENLGATCSEEGKLNDALKYYTLACQAKNLGIPDFLFSDISIDKLSGIEHKEILYSLLFGRTNLLFQYYKKTSQTSYLKAWLKAALLIDTFITQTRHENLGESSKLYWRNGTRSFFNTAIEACYQLHDVSSAFYFIEKSRSVLLNDRWNELNAGVYLSPEEIKQEETLRIKIIEQQQALSALNPSTNEYNKTENKLLQSRNDFDHFVRFLEKAHPRYYESKYDDQVFSISDVQKYLMKNNESYVSYYVNDEATYALSISKSGNKFIKISTTEFDNKQLFRFIQLCSNQQAINSNYPLFSSLAQTIYIKLFQPLSIAPGKVAICTDNFFIPFEALCTDNKGKQFLLNKYSFSYVYSARSLIKPYTCNSKPTGDFAGFAPISFSPVLKVFPLTNSSDALKNVSRYYQNSSLFTEQQSSRYNFLNEASKYAVVTIFSHAQADTTGKEPVLYMQDSLIHLSELQMLTNSSIQFVLLSACQTNIGKSETGEGIYSLARGFASVGVPSVSATLWKADEETIYKISAKFNEYLAGGMNKSDALRQAKLWYLQNSDREHALPYYWANMVLIGTTNPISFSPVAHNWLWFMVGALIIVITGIFFIYKYRNKKQVRIPLSNT